MNVQDIGTLMFLFDLEDKIYRSQTRRKKEHHDMCRNVCVCMHACITACVCVCVCTYVFVSVCMRMEPHTRISKKYPECIFVFINCSGPLP